MSMDTASFERSAELFRSVFDGITPQEFKLPTPCEPFDVAQLITKAIGHLDLLRSGLESARLASSGSNPRTESADRLRTVCARRDTVQAE